METIIGLLFILLPVILKLVGKRLEQSQHTTEILSFPEETSFVEEAPRSIILEESVPEPVMPEPVMPEPVMPEPVKLEPQPLTRKPMLEEEQQPKKEEKIDPKKLVIYSEIMKPKF